MSQPDEFSSGRRSFLLQAAATGAASAAAAPGMHMKPFSPGILSDADMADIYAYVSSRAAPVAIDMLPK